LNKWQCQNEKDYQGRLKEEEYERHYKKKGTKENKPSYIGVVLSSGTVGTKD
jgi:hypothetical protein